MKKFIMGLIFGLMIAIPVGAHAEVASLINQVVQGLFPVTVDGKSLGDAIVVDNKTYLPVRDFGEAAGYTVTFTDDQKVVLTKKVSLAPDIVNTYNDLTNKVQVIIDDKQALEKQISDIHTKNAISGKPDGDDIVALQKQVDEKQAEIDKIMAQRKDLEAQMQALK